MGEAKKRGTYEERKAMAIIKKREQPKANSFVILERESIPPDLIAALAVSFILRKGHI